MERITRLGGQTAQDERGGKGNMNLGEGKRER